MKIWSVSFGYKRYMVCKHQHNDGCELFLVMMTVSFRENKPYYALSTREKTDTQAEQ